jgi:excisionase family DNA binding protein
MLLNCQQAARFLGVSDSFLRRLIRAGKGPQAVRVGKRRKYTEADLRAWVEANKQPA